MATNVDGPSGGELGIELQSKPGVMQQNSVIGEEEEGGREGGGGVTPNERDSGDLKPADRGRAAWTVLVAAFVFEASFWAFLTSFGVFQAYYSSLPQFAARKAQIAVIGTVGQGVVYLGAPFAALLMKWYPNRIKLFLWTGWPLCIVGLLCSSFAKSIPVLIVTQGLMFGVGFLLITNVVWTTLNEWWIVRRGMAYGATLAAGGLAGIFMPIVLETLLHRYGFQITLRAYSVVITVLTAPLMPMLKGRLPLSQVVRQPKPDLSFLKAPFFWFCVAATIIQGFGFFIPPLFLTSYAVEIGLGNTSSASLLSVMAAAQMLGQFVLGWLSDGKIHVGILTSLCCVVAAIATATLWGLGHSFALLAIFSILYGFFAFGFGALRVAISRATSKESSATLAAYSILVFSQGIGNILTGPTAAGLMRDEFKQEAYGAVKYERAIAFVAATSGAGAIIIALPYASKMLRLVVSDLG